MKAHNAILVTLLIPAICALVSPSVRGQCAAPNFQAALRVNAGPLPADIAAGDFNADGRTDFVVPNLSIDEVFVLLGRSIGEPTLIKLTSVRKPSAAGVADFNHDGKLDLVISSDTFGARSVSILLGDGTGGFGPPAKFPAFNVKPLIVGDFNNDGNADVFLGNTSGGLSQLLLGNGIGGLSGGSSFNALGNSGAVAADFNSDGKLDVAQLNSVSFFSVIFGDGAGNFVVTKTFPVTRATFIAAGDFNSDHKTDLVISGQFDRIFLFTGDGEGNFAVANNFSLGFPVNTLAAGDFNTDGKTDIAVTADNRAAILVGDGNGAFGAPNLYRTSNNSTAIDMVVGDFDGDGKTDFATAYQAGHVGSSSIFFGDGSGKFRSPSVLPVGLSPFAITNGDLNNDGHADLAYTNIAHNSVSILISDGSGGFGPATNFPVGAQPRSLALGDLNDDHKLDLVTANLAAGTVSILLGDGQGSFGPASNLKVPGVDPSYVAIGKINNDERPDLVVAYLSSPFVLILWGDGDGTFGFPSNRQIPAGGHDIAINDLNLDGISDLVIATDSGPTLMFGTPIDVFNLVSTLSSSSVAALVVDDFNSDGNADIAALVSGGITIALGDGQGNFLGSVGIQTFGASSFLRAADFNGDGNTDLATSNEAGTVSIMLGNGSGIFAAPVTYYTGGARVNHSLTTGDFNSDGNPDIAVIDEAANVAVIFNACSAPPVTVPAFTISDATVTEPDTGSVNMTFNVSLSAASSKPVVVSFYVPARAAAGVLRFAPGVTEQTITLPVPGDVMDEFDEQFHVLLAFPLNATIGIGQALGTILDNDPPPTISVNDVTVGVDMTFAIFSATLSAKSGKPISVTAATSDGTAQAGVDYRSKTETLNIPAGQINRVFTVVVFADNINEPDENFFANLSDPVNATLADAQGVATIVNDDPIHLILDESGPAANQAAALESVLLVRDPFHVQSIAGWWPNLGPDPRTRVILFATNLHLHAGDPPFRVAVSLVDANNQFFLEGAEDVRELGNTDYTQIVFPLPTKLSPGLCTVSIVAQGKTSNAGTIRIVP